MQQLLVAAEVATERLARRDEIIVDFDNLTGSGPGRWAWPAARWSAPSRRCNRPAMPTPRPAHVQRCRAMEGAARSTGDRAGRRPAAGVRIVPSASVRR
ncbi:MAG: hypothetical protein R2755_14565 [Acidimicrobiales bacterium]